MFSYACTKCGVKDCFDFMEEVVVKVDMDDSIVHVKGTYDGFGNVRIPVRGQDDPVLAVPEQHEWQMKMKNPSNGSLLLATDIYCNGELQWHSNNSRADPKAILNQSLKKQAKQQMKELNALIGGGLGLGDGYESGDDEPRFCVPEELQVLDELTPELLSRLPSSSSTNDENDENINPNPEPKIKTSSKKRKLDLEDGEIEEKKKTTKKVAVIWKETALGMIKTAVLMPVAA